IQTLQTIYADYGEHLYGEYGFRDSFNPSFDFDTQPPAGQVIAGKGWFGTDYIGIDQGPILLMTENLRSEMVWNVMKTNPYIRLGLERAGFTGGWLADQ
ncbi:MAG: glucoamylase family protein, partial [Porticoccaceae bacterium]